MVRRRISIFFILGVIILQPLVSPTAYAEPPNSSIDRECLIYAYAESGNHLFLLESNKTVFGENVTVIHNCESIEIFSNGTFEAFTNLSKFNLVITQGLNNLEFRSNNYSKNITNLLVMPDRLSWEFEFYEWDNRNQITFEEYISISKAQAAQNWVSILSIVVVFTLTTMVYWHLINSYVDRNYCEEIKN